MAVRWLVDSYEEWVGKEGLPLYKGLAIDLTKAECAPWDRLGVNGAFVHIDARGDYLNMYIVEIPAGGATAPQRHLFEEVFYVLHGRGSTELERPDGSLTSFEWGQGSLIAMPLNARYRLFNLSGQGPARLVSVTNLPMMMKLFRNEDFIFDNDAQFPERLDMAHAFDGDGLFIENREHRHMWETSFIPDLLAFDELRESPSRGKGSKNMMFLLADGTLHAHMSEIPPLGYKKAHKHGEGYHIVQLSGTGYSLYWYENEPMQRVDWHYGLLHSPPNQMIHQHFNCGAEPARYLAIAFGSHRYPFTREKRELIEHDYRKKSSRQIEYEDQDPDIDRMFKEELNRLGAHST